jgi:hypothetical protein
LERTQVLLYQVERLEYTNKCLLCVIEIASIVVVIAIRVVDCLFTMTGHTSTAQQASRKDKFIVSDKKSVSNLEFRCNSSLCHLLETICTCISCEYKNYYKMFLHVGLSDLIIQLETINAFCKS